MASKYSLNLQLQLQSPQNVAQVVSSLQKQLGGVSVNVQVKNSKQAVQQVQQLTNATNAAQTAAEKMGDAFGVSLKRFAAFSLASRAIGVFTRYLSNAVDESIAFDRQLNRIKQVTRASETSLNDLSKEITRLSKTFGVASSEITETALILAQAGLSANDTKVALEALTKTRLSATFGDINETAEGAVALLAQFGEGAGALERQLSAVNKVSAQFAVESEDLIEVIRRTGGVFKASGGNLEELLGLFTSVRATTREGAESIATALKTIFTRIQRPQTIQYLKELGVELVNAEGAFVGPFEAIKRLSAAFGSLEQGSLKFIEIAEELGGYRQIGKVIPLLQQFAVAERARQSALAGGTSLTEEAAIAQESLAVQFQKVREEFLALIRSTTQTDTFKILTKTVLSLATSLIKVADALKPVLPLLAAFAAIKFTKNIGGFFGGIGAALQKKQFGGKIHKFASGGIVPGSGNRDTVPAMLTPGEFVIRKSSVNKLGAGTLAAMNENRFQRGGRADRVREEVKSLRKEPTFNFTTLGKKNAQGIREEYARISKDDKLPDDITATRRYGAAFLSPDGISKELNGSIDLAELARTKKIDDPRYKGKIGIKYYIGSLSEALSKDVENTIFKGVLFSVEKGSQKLSKALKVPKISDQQTAKQLRDINIDNIIGNIFEGIITRTGVPYTPEARDRANATFDYPEGLGAIADQFQNKKLKRIKVDAKTRFTNENVKSLLEKAESDIIANLGNLDKPQYLNPKMQKSISSSDYKKSTPKSNYTREDVLAAFGDSSILFSSLQKDFPGITKEELDSFGLTRKTKTGMRYVKKFFGGAIQRFAVGSKGTGVKPLQGRKAYVFDFDDTLAETEARVGAEPNNPDKFSQFRGDLAAKLIDSGQATKIASMAKKRAQLGHDIYVLTARPSEPQTVDAISRFMQRIGAPAKGVIGVGNMFAGEREPGKRPGTTRLLTTGSKKAKILSQIAPNYDQTWFLDDAIENLISGKQVAGVKTALADTKGKNVVKRFAAGGVAPSDTVPALLTPGEFVFSKKAAQSIGYGALNRMNKQGVTGYAKGGPVGFRFGGEAAQQNITSSFDREGTALVKSMADVKNVFQNFISNLTTLPEAVKEIVNKVETFELTNDTKVRGTNSGAISGGQLRGVSTGGSIGINFQQKANVHTVKHEGAHEVDRGLGKTTGLKGATASLQEGTFQNKVAKELQETYQKIGDVSKYRLGLEELFADALAKAPPEVQKILVSTTDAAEGSAKLAKYFEQAGKPIEGLADLSADEFGGIQDPKKRASEVVKRESESIKQRKALIAQMQGKVAEKTAQIEPVKYAKSSQKEIDILEKKALGRFDYKDPEAKKVREQQLKQLDILKRDQETLSRLTKEREFLLKEIQNEKNAIKQSSQTIQKIRDVEGKPSAKSEREAGRRLREVKPISPPSSGGPPGGPPVFGPPRPPAGNPPNGPSPTTPTGKKPFDATAAIVGISILQNVMLQLAESSGFANDELAAFSNGLLQFTATTGLVGAQFKSALEQQAEIESQGGPSKFLGVSRKGLIKGAGFAAGGLAAAGAVVGAIGGYQSQQAEKRFEQTAAGAKTTEDFAKVEAAGQENVQQQIGAKKLQGFADVGTFAGIGATIGSIFGPLGTAIGGLVGALAGLGKGIYNLLSLNEQAIQEEQNRKNADIAATLAAKDAEKAFKDLERGSAKFSGAQGLGAFASTVAKANKVQIDAANKTGVSEDVRQKAQEEATQRILQSASAVGQRAKTEEEARKIIEQMAQESGFTGEKLKQLKEQAGGAAAAAVALRNAQQELARITIENTRLSSAFNSATLAVDGFMNSLQIGSIGLTNTIASLEAAANNVNMGPEGEKAIAEIEKAATAQVGGGTGFGQIIQNQANRARLGLALGGNMATALQGVSGSLVAGDPQNKERVKEALLATIPEGVDSDARAKLETLINSQVDNLDLTSGTIPVDQLMSSLQGQIKSSFIDPLSQTGKSLIQQQQRLVELTRTRIEAENKLVEAQKSALELQLESQKTIAEFTGKKVTPADEFAIRARQFDVGGRAAGIGSVGAGTAQDIRRVSGEISARFAAQQSQLGGGGTGGGAAELDKDQRDRLKRANQDLIALTRQRIEQTKQELDIIKEKNALEKGSIDKLLGGDFEGALADLQASAAASALRTGNTELLSNFSLQSIGQGAKSLEGQLSKEDFGKVVGGVLGQYGIQDSRLAQVYSGTTPEEKRLMERGQQEAGLLAQLGQNEVGFAEMELKSADMNIQTANIKFNEALQEAQSRDKATQDQLAQQNIKQQQNKPLRDAELALRAAREDAELAKKENEKMQRRASEREASPLFSEKRGGLFGGNKIRKEQAEEANAAAELEAKNTEIKRLEEEINRLKQQSSTELQRKARGGIIYANRGIFVPRGTDRVPAMLTPGEFVVRREAVQSGNNLQILQAMNRGGNAGSVLSNGVQALAGGGTVQNITNNNNNIDVEQFSNAVGKLEQAISQIPREFFHQFNGSTSMSVTGLAGLTDVMKNIASDAVMQMAPKLKTDVTGNVQINNSVLG